MCPALTNVTQESKGFICEFIVYASYSFGKHIPDPPIKETSMFERKMIVPSRNKKRQDKRRFQFYVEDRGSNILL